ncbi:MAG: DUF4399 domain-containing protein [Minwuia sp.]|uniref:DUF4399 domain-containing protein n=1 Tax=Minwuia sp. TaxID=2493630 RepID=UPI003A87EF5B
MMRILAALMLLALPGAALAQSPWPEGAEVYIVSPADGAEVTSPVRVIFGLRGMGVAPAGVEKENTGHHHLLIDRPLPTGEDLQYNLPAEETLRHFGGGQTEALIELSPGQHTLQLLMGDANHVPFDPPVASKVVTITVK